MLMPTSLSGVSKPCGWPVCVWLSWSRSSPLDRGGGTHLSVESVNVTPKPQRNEERRCAAARRRCSHGLGILAPLATLYQVPQ